jgi:transposase
MGVAVGIDSHKSSLAAGAIDELGRSIATSEFRNDPQGHTALMRWIAALGENRRVGIEGSGQFGAAATRLLLESGEAVFEVPAFMTHRERVKRPSRGKSDPGDAHAIAMVVAREDHLTQSSLRGANDDLKLLVERRDQLVRHKTKTANRIHKHLVVLVPGYEIRVPRVTRRCHITRVRRLLRGDTSVQARIVRDLMGDWIQLESKIAVLTKDISQAVIASGTTLTGIKGVGFLTAAKILGEIGDIGRIRSKAAFAMLNGTAPIEASSGYSKRHRLNRGGNRQLNHALHIVALARCRSDEATQNYRARRIASGDSTREALRALKRQISNLIYRHLMLDLAASKMGA